MRSDQMVKYIHNVSQIPPRYSHTPLSLSLSVCPQQPGKLVNKTGAGTAQSLYT